VQIRPLTPGWAARHWPLDSGAIARNLVGILAVAAVTLRWGPVGAATVAAGAATIAGAAALQDNPRGPGSRVVALSIAMGSAVAIGALTSAHDAVFVVAVAAWCLAAGMVWALGVNTGLVATAAGALLVTAPPTPLGDAAPVAGLAVAGGLVQAVLITVRPRRRWRAQRTALRRAYRSLAEDARELSNDAATRVDPAPLRYLRDAFTLSDHQARRRPLEYRRWYGLPERIAATLAAVSDRVSDPATRSGVLASAADTLEGLAVRSRSQAERGAAAVSAAATSAPGPDGAVVQRLSAQLSEAVGLRFAAVAASPAELLRGTDIVTAVRRRAAVVRAQLQPRSPILRHAVRLAAAATVGTAFARWTEAPHGFWIALTALLVLRPETAHTYTRCAGRLAGLALGVVVASLIAMMWQPGGLPAAVLAVLCLGVAYGVSTFGYIAVNVGLGAAIVFLVDISGVAGPVTITERLSAVLIGGGLAVVAHVLLPDDERVRLSQRAGELLKAEVDYAATVITAFVHAVDRPADALAAAWQRAFRSRAAFEAACGAARLESKELRLWLRSYRSALNAVTAACTALEAGLPSQPPATLTTAFVTAVDDYADILRGGFTDPATPWTVDGEALAAASAEVRAAAAGLPSDLSSARLLVGEIAAITGHLARMSPGRQGPDPP
jgi:uncharacterized membrane protein YccC